MLDSFPKSADCTMSITFGAMNRTSREKKLENLLGRSLVSILLIARFLKKQDNFQHSYNFKDS